MIKLQFSLVKSHNCMQTFAAVQHFYKPILIKVKKLIRQETNLGERDICLFILNWLGRKADACMLLPKNHTFKQHSKWPMILPASGQEHGFFDENWARQQDVPAASYVIRAERQKEIH